MMVAADAIICLCVLLDDALEGAKEPPSSICKYKIVVATHIFFAFEASITRKEAQSPTSHIEVLSPRHRLAKALLPKCRHWHLVDAPLFKECNLRNPPKEGITQWSILLVFQDQFLKQIMSKTKPFLRGFWILGAFISHFSALRRHLNLNSSFFVLWV